MSFCIAGTVYLDCRGCVTGEWHPTGGVTWSPLSSAACTHVRSASSAEAHDVILVQEVGVNKLNLSEGSSSFLGVRKPIPYRMFNNTRHSTGNTRKHGHKRHMRGINFAFGGSGVFPTFGTQYPNISSQINQLQDLISRGLVSKKLMKAAMVVLVIAGNDYTVYNQHHPNYQGLLEFIPQVVEEMAASLEALHKLGFKRIAATNLAPVGCLPGVTIVNNYTTCISAINNWSALHNTLLKSHISSLQAKHPRTQFLTLDLHSAFETVMSDAELQLRPCCDGVNESSSCGDVGKNGVPLYNLCSFSNHTLFWDNLHPTNAGWKAISKALF